MTIKSDVVSFPIDYAKSVSDVYQDITKFSIKKDRSLQVLYKFEVQPVRNQDIPSWSVNWRNSVKENGLQVETSVITFTGPHWNCYKMILLLRSIWPSLGSSVLKESSVAS